MKTSRLPALFAAAAVLAAAVRAEEPKFTLKFATLAPDGSAWMQTFDQIRSEVAEATGGRVVLRAYPGGVLGEEKDVLFKMKVGQVDGAGLLGYGIARICPDSRALMLPLVFRDFAELDAVFSRIQPYLEAQSARNGYVALGWTEVGFGHLFSTEPVRTIRDLQGAKPWLIPGDPVIAELYKAGGVSGIPVPVGDVLTALQTGLLRTVFAPPLAAVAMQWFTRVKYRNDLPLVYSFGGFFVSQSSWEKVPAEFRGKISEISHRRLGQLTADVRKNNEEALRVMTSNRIETVRSTPEEVNEFRAVSATATRAMEGREFSPEAYRLVQQYLAEFRAGKAGSAP